MNSMKKTNFSPFTGDIRGLPKPLHERPPGPRVPCVSIGPDVVGRDGRGSVGPHPRRGQRNVSEEDGCRGGRGGFRVFRGPSTAMLEIQ